MRYDVDNFKGQQV
jgi:gas vesicle protein